MFAPLSWLCDFADFGDDVDALRAALDDLGLVVEGIEQVGEGLAEVVCVAVRQIEPIEGADKIRKITVDTGDGELVIVCGAWNFEVGDVVPLAPVGSVLPGGFAISKRKMKGIESDGMLCSAAELKLSDDHGGLLVLTDVAAATPGTLVTEALGIAPDVVFELAVEGNRPDAWCIAGVARDLAARLGLEFHPPRHPAPPVVDAAGATASIADPQRCVGLRVTSARGVVVGPSPQWMSRRLTMAGMRPINNVVDASNYVMLELGQPNHAYDLATLAGPAIGVRLATPGEQIETLDAVVRTLGLAGRGLGDSGHDLVIVDGADRPIGIAGIMGGAATEIDAGTTTLALEAACFAPMGIAQTSKKLGLRSEASARFERGVDPELAQVATDRFFELLALTVPGLEVLAPAAVAVGDRQPPVVLEVSARQLGAVLGVELDHAEVSRLLTPLGFSVAGDDEALEVTVPSNRPDLRPMPFGVADLAEEVARTYGYSRLPRRTPSWPSPGGLTPLQRTRRRIREVLCGLGFDEAWTPTLVDAGAASTVGLTEPAVTLTNPLSADEGALRQSMLPGLLAALRYNLDRRRESAALFELGTVFSHPDHGDGARAVRGGAAGAALVTLPGETEHLVVVARRPGDDAAVAVAVAQALFARLGLEPPQLVQPLGEAGALAAGAHPTRSAELRDQRSGAVLGVVGEVDPAVLEAAGLAGDGARVALVAIDLGRLTNPEFSTARPATTVVPSRFPSSDFDLAVVAPDEVVAATLETALKTAAGALGASVRLFDVYRGPGVPEGSRSLAYRIRVEAADRTLTDAEVQQVRQDCIAALHAAGATLR